MSNIEEKKKKLKVEKKKKPDRCTRIAKRKYDVWPSAYASGAVVKCRQGKIWKGIKEVEEKDENTEELNMLRQISNKLDTLEDLDASIDYLAAVLSGEDTVSVGVRQKFFGRGAQAEPVKIKEKLRNRIEEKKKKRKVKKKKAKTDYSKEKKSGLHGWFSRQGGKGKSKGWVDCNTCRTDKKTGRKTCKSCGRKDGEKRSKYPSCRPTPSACGTKGKGKKWGKRKESLEMMNENNFIARVVAEILKDEQFRMLETYYHISDATYDDGTPVDENMEFWDDVVVEAEYRGRKVKLNKPMRGDVKKFKVYVKDPKTGNVKKVNFGQKGMKIKKSNPGRRKNFRARHNCDNPGPKTKARYWSCRKW
tara:strand:+ start:1149 stop:2234 length:1086 start_codon:yes stop_codon:yes gene_type:complete